MAYPTDIDPPSKDFVQMIRSGLEPLDEDLDSIMARIGDAKVVLMGESTHGTEECYRFRARLTQKLVEEKGFYIVALEADWPDVSEVNDYIAGRREGWDGFQRFPEWMWRNEAFSEFVETLKGFNQSERHRPVSIFGLDLYSLSASLDAVGRYLENDPKLAQTAQSAAKCFQPWREDPTQYGLAVWAQRIQGCRDQVERILAELTKKQNARINGEWLSVLQNARVLQSAEQYYRIMYEAGEDSWNLRDRHMFSTLNFLLEHFGEDAKAIVWEHNSHIGDARATQMGDSGEHNVGQLCRQCFGSDAYLLGFSTDHGTVAAASRWGGPMQVKTLLPARPDSYEALMHATGVPQFSLPLREKFIGSELVKALLKPRLERAVGVLYLPESERASHYFYARLPQQFDELIWIDETSAIRPLPYKPEVEAPDMYPSGL